METKGFIFRRLSIPSLTSFITDGWNSYNIWHNPFLYLNTIYIIYFFCWLGVFLFFLLPIFVHILLNFYIVCWTYISLLSFHYILEWNFKKGVQREPTEVKNTTYTLTRKATRRLFLGKYVYANTIETRQLQTCTYHYKNIRSGDNKMHYLIHWW